MFVDTPDGTSIYYEVNGSGPPLLLIAGTGCDHLWWSLQVEDLAQDFTVITCNSRGSGRSTIYPNVEDYSSEVMADDMAALVRHLDLGPVHVVGHSLGSCIAQQLAIRHPDLVLSAQLHATWSHADEWLKRAFIETMAYPTRLGDAHSAWKTVGMWIFSPQYLEERTPAHVAAAVSSAFVTNPHLDNHHGLLGHLHADRFHDTREQLHSISVPTLVTAGELDVSFPPRYGFDVYERIPGARWHLFTGPRAAHAFNLEMSHEFNELVRDFARQSNPAVVPHRQ
ncbi:alpha/beta fold hydrolase [Arthrobacter crystallopoietes]|uniref:alpha/beta fold hydrolase n=1 Tax=Crystallibacter crystallopoietes TaxID=37928 RepID=UPI0011111331|nr:alpha/beta fold hydrolase [Arthrobacter crystallopoietes]